jgi:hypothetical protein
MWAVLFFIILQPGILFSFPPKGGLLTIVVHALFFGALVQLFKEETVEPFQTFDKTKCDCLKINEDPRCECPAKTIEQTNDPINGLTTILAKIKTDKAFRENLPENHEYYTQRFTKILPFIRRAKKGVASTAVGFKNYEGFVGKKTELGLSIALDGASQCWGDQIGCQLNNINSSVNKDCSTNPVPPAPVYINNPTDPGKQIAGNTGSAPITSATTA